MVVGTDDFLDALPPAFVPAGPFPVNKLKQLLKSFRSCVEHIICVNEEFEKKRKIKAVYTHPLVSHG